MRFIAFVFIICACGLTFLDEQGIEAQKQYCENVELFELQTDKPMHERDGHPNYRGIECDKEKQVKG